MEERRSIVFIIIIGGVIFAWRTKIIKFKRHTNHLISSINFLCSITIFSFSILFYNVNNNFWKFHKLQIYLNSYIPFAKQWPYVEFTLFCNGFTLKTTYAPWDIEFKWFLSLKFNKNPKYDFFSPKFVTIRYLKIVRFPITHLVFLESPRCIGVHTLASWHFTRIKSSFATKFCNWKLSFATILTNFSCKN
jgi:hypothetical protein